KGKTPFFFSHNHNIVHYMWIWWGILVLGCIWLAEAWLFWHHHRPMFLSRLLVRNRYGKFWTAFHNATPGQWAATWALAIPPYILSITGLFFMSLAFNVHIPFLEFVGISPLVVAVLDMPIAFAGFGTTTMAFNIFFGEYGSPQNIAALTLFYPFVRAVLRAVIGLISLQPALMEIHLLLQKPENKTG
ncbi:MAG: hypothetical protein ACOC7U_06315, partial [Spirochaetota bacterium]